MLGSHPGDGEANNRAMENHLRALEARQGAEEAHPGTMEVPVSRPLLQSCNLQICVTLIKIRIGIKTRYVLAFLKKLIRIHSNSHIRIEGFASK
jgi:hypothetical protein